MDFVSACDDPETKDQMDVGVSAAGHDQGYYGSVGGPGTGLGFDSAGGYADQVGQFDQGEFGGGEGDFSTGGPIIASPSGFGGPSAESFYPGTPGQDFPVGEGQYGSMSAGFGGPMDASPVVTPGMQGNFSPSLQTLPGSVGSFGNGFGGQDFAGPMDFSGGYGGQQQFGQMLPLNQYQIQNDPNPLVIKKRYTGAVPSRTQKVKIRYLRAVTPPPAGPLIIKEVRAPAAAPPPPVIIKQKHPIPPTPPPLILRERPPPMPAVIPPQVVTRTVPGPAPPKRQVIIHRCPKLPPKPRDIIIERWIPYAQQVKRRVIHQRAPPAPQHKPQRNMIVQWEAQVKYDRKVLKDIVKMDPDQYCQQYGQSLLSPDELVSRARTAGVNEDLTPPSRKHATGLQSGADGFGSSGGPGFGDFGGSGYPSSGQDFGGSGFVPSGQDFGGSGFGPSGQDFGGSGFGPSGQDFGGLGYSSSGQDFGGSGFGPNGQDFVQSGPSFGSSGFEGIPGGQGLGSYGPGMSSGGPGGFICRDGSQPIPAGGSMAGGSMAGGLGSYGVANAGGSAIGSSNLPPVYSAGMTGCP